MTARASVRRIVARGISALAVVVDKYDTDNWWDRADWADARITCG